MFKYWFSFKVLHTPTTSFWLYSYILYIIHIISKWFHCYHLNHLSTQKLHVTMRKTPNIGLSHNGPVVIMQESWNGTSNWFGYWNWWGHIVHQEGRNNIYFSHNKTFWREKFGFPSRSKNGLREQGGAPGFGFYCGYFVGGWNEVPLYGLGLP